MKQRTLAVAVAIAFVAGAVLAQPYRWVDEKGRVQYTDTPPPPSAKDVKKTAVPPPVKPSAEEPPELQRAMKEFPVTLYTHPDCKEPCQLARDALNRRGVPFKETPIYNKQGSDELIKLAGSDEVPVLTVGSGMQKGFAQDAYDALLTSAGYPRTGLLPARTQPAPTPPSDYIPPGQTAPGPVAAPVKPEAPPAPRGPYSPTPGTEQPPKPGPYAPGASAAPAPKPEAKSQ